MHQAECCWSSFATAPQITPTPGIEYVISDFNHLAGKDLFFQLHFVKEKREKLTSGLGNSHEWA
jgi:hypothetical protein